MSEPDAELPNAPLWRRLLAILYDGLLLAAVLMVATAVLLPLTGGEAIPKRGNTLYQLYLLAVGTGFFALFWRHGGQTLGMRAWRLRLQGAHGPVSWREAWLRAGAALLSWLPLGLGFAWSLIDRERLAWHDRLSGTRLVVTPRR